MEAVPLSYLPRYDAEPKETKLALLRKFMAEETLACPPPSPHLENKGFTARVGTSSHKH